MNISKIKGCTSLTELPDDFKWDTSNVSELKQLINMNKVQVKYCWDKDLFHNYSMIGMAAIIDGKIKAMFNELGN